MKKHGVIMVFLLFLALCLMGTVSASDNLTVSDTSTPVAVCQEDSQMQVENNIESDYQDNSHSDYNGEDNVVSSSYSESENSHIGSVVIVTSIDGSIFEFKNTDLNLENQEFDMGDIINYLHYFNTGEIKTFKITKINNETVKNVLNKVINASNGYVNYDNSDLLSLSSMNTDLNIAFFINNDESNNLSYSGNYGLISANLWKNLHMLVGDNYPDTNVFSLITGLSSDNNPITLNVKPFLTGIMFNQSKIQYLFNYPPENKFDLPLGNTVLGASRDSDDDAFVWIVNSDERAFIGVDMVDESEAGFLNLNLKSAKTQNLSNSHGLSQQDMAQLGADASLMALDYFKSQGIDIQKGYPYLYALTSAGYVEINNASTVDAIDGISQVLGLELNKNIFPLQTPLWKDLVFYFIWVNSANNANMLSYAVVYNELTSTLDVSDEARKQGDQFAYEMGLYKKNDVKPVPHTYYPVVHMPSVVEEISNTTDVNSTVGNNTNNSDNISNISRNEFFSVSNKGNPYNIIYTVIAMLIITAIFGVGYSKRS